MTNTPIPSVLIAGHSHTVALGLGTVEDLPPEIVRLRTGPPEILGLRYRMPASSDFVQMVIDASEGRDLVLLWQGNYHQSKYLLSPGTRFDFVLSSESELPNAEAAVLVPESLLIRGLALELDMIETALQRLQASCPARRILLVSPPPPKGDDEHLRRHLAVEFTPILEPMGYGASDVPITSVGVRLKIWKLFVRLHAELAARLGVDFLSAPPECADEAGLLARQYWAPDVTHANHFYGERLLERIANHLPR